MKIIRRLIRFILFAIAIYLIIIPIFGYETAKQENESHEVYAQTEQQTEQQIEQQIGKESLEVEYIDVWTIENANIKKEPISNSETVGTYYWNANVSVTYINDYWAKIEGSDYYIDRLQTSETSASFIDCDVPSNNAIKSYMDYKYITSKTSDQYKLQESLAYTGENGLRMVNGRYCMAVGSYYTTTIGQYMDIELENGKVIPAILADCKADIHTDETNRMNPNGSVIEFVVETNSLYNKARIMGDISYVNGWDSKVVNIKVYDKVEKFK
jgi:hypothetical protein